MNKTLAALALVGALATPGMAWAQSRTTMGVGSGAVAGALVGGPIGAVAGAVRRGRRDGYAGGRRSDPRRAEAELPRATGAVSRTAPPAPTRTGWKDPH
jgi:hypothetical protein